MKRFRLLVVLSLCILICCILCACSPSDSDYDDSSVQKYSVTWKNYDGTVLEKDSEVVYGTVPEYNGITPTKPSTERYSYAFNGWTPTIVPVTEDVVYTAQFAETTNTYSVIWENYDGTILEKDNEVAYGEVPEYNGITPTKPSTGRYSYSFNGWTPTIVPVTKNVVYTAQFNESTNTYSVIWKNYDGTILEKDNEVAYGEVPEYNGITPTKPSTERYSYAFNGWTPTIVPVTEDVVYTAQFAETINTYSVIWKNYDGTILENGLMPEYNGAMPIKGDDDIFRYSFIGWDKEIAPVVSDIIYIAQFSSAYKEDFIFETVGNKCFLKKYVGVNESVVIPSTYQNHPVVSILSNAFDKKACVKSLYVPTSVIEIQKNALSGCTNIERLILPFVGDGADIGFIGYVFGAANYEENAQCVPYSLSSIRIYNANIIASNAFYGCKYLEYVEISDDITSIGDGCLAGCASLSKMRLPFVGESYNSKNSFGYIFGTNNYSNSQIVSQNGQIFYIPNSLSEVEITGGCILTGAFENCAMIQKISIEQGVSIIEEESFANCNSLREIYVDSAVEIKAYAFAKLCNLEKIKVPIQDYSYSDSEYLWTLYHIGRMFNKEEYGGCDAITQSSKGKGIGSNAGVGSGGGGTYYIPTSLKEIVVDCKNDILGYGALSGIANVEFVINNCTGIAEYSLSRTSIKTFIIPKGLTEIPEGAFSECELLESIVIPYGVTTIQNNAFRGCISLKTIVVPKTLSGIGELSFSGCKSLENIDFIRNCAEEFVIGRNAFIECTGLKKLIIPSNVCSIYYGAFGNCSEISSVTFEDGSTCAYIGGAAFHDCTKLEYVVIPSSALTLGESVFSGDTSLIIYAEFNEKPSRWGNYWNKDNNAVYWLSEWKYDESGFPCPNND